MKRLKHTFVLGIFAIIFLLFYVFEFSWDCPIKKYLHFACPGCGLTRSIRALLNFNLIGSIKYNLLGIPLVISIIIISMFLIKDIINNTNKVEKKVYTIFEKNYKIILIILVIITIINNINGV
jgi:hypothetical protein